MPHQGKKAYVWRSAGFRFPRQPPGISPVVQGKSFWVLLLPFGDSPLSGDIIGTQALSRRTDGNRSSIGETEPIMHFKWLQGGNAMKYSYFSIFMPIPSKESTLMKTNASLEGGPSIDKGRGK